MEYRSSGILPDKALVRRSMVWRRSSDPNSEGILPSKKLLCRKSFDRLTKVKDRFVSRKILPVSLSYDHRIIDGAEGARFCVYLGKCLGKDFAFKLAV